MSAACATDGSDASVADALEIKATSEPGDLEVVAFAQFRGVGARNDQRARAGDGGLSLAARLAVGPNTSPPTETVGP